MLYLVNFKCICRQILCLNDFTSCTFLPLLRLLWKVFQHNVMPFLIQCPQSSLKIRCFFRFIKEPCSSVWLPSLSSQHSSSEEMDFPSAKWALRAVVWLSIAFLRAFEPFFRTSRGLSIFISGIQGFKQYGLGESQHCWNLGKHMQIYQQTIYLQFFPWYFHIFFV